MKTIIASSAVAILLAAVPAVAFPAMAGQLLNPQIAGKLVEKRQSSPPQGAGFLPATPPPFSASAQYVSTTGQYAFVAPGSGDARGECPGLNAMANHGYLPHNGVATIAQFMSATYTVFGMSTDLSGFLAYYGAFVDGNGAGWSIEGGPHVGIGGSHNDYEADSSPLKSDLNQYGSNEKLIISQFMTLYNMQPNASTANYNLPVLAQFRGERFAESIMKNPYFSYLPFSGILVTQAAYTFIYRFMSNKSAQYPEGILNKAVLKSFMSITGPENNLTWTKGYERIPDNWYKRNDADEYSIPYFMSDVFVFGETQPEIYDVGCNEGHVNSYNSISPTQISDGAYTLQQVAANPFCYGYEFMMSQAQSQFGFNASYFSQFQNAIAPYLPAAAANCTAFAANMSVLDACPGYSNYGGPMGQVAPGAIMS